MTSFETTFDGTIRDFGLLVLVESHAWPKMIALLQSFMIDSVGDWTGHNMNFSQSKGTIKRAMQADNSKC